MQTGPADGIYSFVGLGLAHILEHADVVGVPVDGIGFVFGLIFKSFRISGSVTILPRGSA
jgi:hypothetical protein